MIVKMYLFLMEILEFNYEQIRKHRNIKKIINTSELVKIIEESKNRKYSSKINPCTKTFQAIRIFVNKEITELINGIINATKKLKPGGKILIISFHSLEDRLVKNTFNKLCGEKNAVNRHLPILNSIEKHKFVKVGKPFFIPTEKEIFKNPKARSAKLRVIERVNIQNEKIN